MTAYNRTPLVTFSSLSISQDVAERRAARRKVIERAQQVERDSYKALMRKKRNLQADSTLADETLKAGQDAIREELTKKADKIAIHRLEQKMDKSNKHLQDHEERLEVLEEDQLSPHKN